jgi:methyl-accepting chemotaxis protein
LHAAYEEGIKVDMVQFLSKIPIFRRLFIAFAITAIIPALVILLLSNFYLNTLSRQQQAVHTSFDAQSVASQQQVNLQRMNALVQTRFNQIFASLQGKVSDPSLANAGGLVDSDIAAREAQFNQALQDYQTNFDLATSPHMSTVRSILISNDPSTAQGIIADQQTAIRSVATANTGLWAKYRKLQEQEVKLLDSLDPTVRGNPTTLSLNSLSSKYEQAYSLLWHANFDFTELNNSWQHVVDDAVSMGKTVTSIGPSVTQPILIASFIAVFSTIVVIVATGWVVNLTITSPLRGLAMLTRRIARGETGARARIFGRDEIYLVATSMNNMLDNIVRLIQETQAQRDSLQAQVEKLVSEVSGVGEGDLRVQAEVTVDTLGVLADSFNYMVEELSSLIVRVKLVAHEVENSTVMILDHMTQLVENGDIQIQQIANATAGVEHIADSSRHVAERAQVLYKIARETRLDAQSGRASMQQSLEGIERIHETVQATANKVQLLGDRSREIDEIVAAISNIAHQTNRLALDAAIQAAMAGENGKGFGAVAADIRRLAERAKEEASMVARIVRSIREDIGAVAVAMQDTEHETSVGAQLTQEAGTTLGLIFSAIDHEAEEIETISLMTTQQLQSSGAIVQIMQGVSNVTEQSGTSTRDASQNMERLARLVEQLRASVEAFKLREDQTYYSPPQFDAASLENEQDNQMTVSGIFRTVTGAAQSANADRYNNALAPAHAGTSWSLMPASYAAYQQQNTMPSPYSPPQNKGAKLPYPSDPQRNYIGVPPSQSGWLPRAEGRENGT